MQSSPYSALLTYPLKDEADAFKPFMMWWLNYTNIVIKLSDDFPEAEEIFPDSFWNIDRQQECLFVTANLTQLLNLTKSRRLYFIGKDLLGGLETDLRVASALRFDPVLVWNSDALGSIPDHDQQRLSRFCEIAETANFLKGFERGWQDFPARPKGVDDVSG